MCQVTHRTCHLRTEVLLESRCKCLIGVALQEIHVGVGRVEQRRRHVGGDVVRGAPLLELVQPRRHQGDREVLPAPTSHGKDPLDLVTQDHREYSTR